ncbi:MAG: hypothetical protein HYZ88_03535 [Candidatus Omnitrophica bacterium]|nr:hypothetical protein [Candidatus Omnitrophota bacterium]
MNFHRFSALVLTGACLLTWADPGDRGGQALAAGNGAASSSRSHLALRASQKADTLSGVEEITEALSLPHPELSTEAQTYFEEAGGDDPDGPTVLSLVPLKKDGPVLTRYRKRAGRIVILKDEKEPSGRIGRDLLRRIVREINPHYLTTFVNDPVKAYSLLDEDVTPRLTEGGINHMGQGTNNLDLLAAARRGIRVSYIGGTDYNPLRKATAETAVMLALNGWFDLPMKVQTVRSGLASDRSGVVSLEAWGKSRSFQFSVPEEEALTQAIWAQFHRQKGRVEDGVQLIREGRFFGAGNGSKRTVRWHQLSPDDRIRLSTTVGFLAGSPLVITRWAHWTRGHGVKGPIFYSGIRLDELLEQRYGLTYLPDPEDVAKQSDYLLRFPGAPGFFTATVSQLDEARKYPWKVDPQELFLRSDEPGGWRGLLRDNSLRSKTVGIVGLGNVGSAAAEFLSGLGVRLISYPHDVSDRARFDRTAGRLKVDSVDGLEAMVDQADLVIFTLPDQGDTWKILTPELLRRIGNRKVILVNVGRGSLIGSTEDERVFAAELKRHPNIRYAADVYANETLSLNEQPLLDPDDAELARRVIGTPHFASNAGDPRGVSVREDGMGGIVADNLEAMLAGKSQEQLPNPVDLSEFAAGMEEIQQALEQLDGLEYVWEAPPAERAPSRPILLDATEQETIRHLAQALAIFLGSDNRSGQVLDFRLVVPEQLRQRTMNELSRVNGYVAQYFLENRLVSYDGLEKSREQARQEALGALVPDLPAGQTPEKLAAQGDLLLVQTFDRSWIEGLQKYLEQAGLWMLDETSRRLEVLLEAA